jgi:hypothetical protein
MQKMLVEQESVLCAGLKGLAAVVDALERAAGVLLVGLGAEYLALRVREVNASSMSIRSNSICGWIILCPGSINGNNAKLTNGADAIPTGNNAKLRRSANEKNKSRHDPCG